MLRDEFARLGVMARRAQQYSGTESTADVLVQGLELYVECKNTDNIRMRDWIIQASRDAKGQPFGVFYHLPRSVGIPNGDWLVIMRLAHWADDSKAFAKAREFKNAEIKRIIEDGAREGF